MPLEERGEADGRVAWIALRNAQVLAARIGGEDSLGSVGAVAAVLAWPAGDFELEAGDIEIEVGQSTTSLLMTAACLLDETGRGGFSDDDQGLRPGVVRESQSGLQAAPPHFP